MEPFMKFSLWFISGLVGITLVGKLFNNNFITAFVSAVVFGVLAVRSD